MPCQIVHSWNLPRAAGQFRSGVSLHSHTLHSRENMSFVARHLARIPLAGSLVRREEAKYRRRFGRELDYSRAWWTPPLPPSDAFRLESGQIASLGLRPIVSITDHDSIDAGRELQLLGIDAPVSVEWSVPFQSSFLHIGVHNLPALDAPNWMRLFAFWTARPNPAVLRDILAGLHAMPGVLTVVNHPLWDEGGIGFSAQYALVREFIASFRPFLHAVELNGLRSWKENRQVLAIAAAAAIPAISGGDRHGCEPNANINLTNAASFSEFAEEIRSGRQSQVLFLPQYRTPLRLRCAKAVRDTLRDYPEYPGRESWGDRIFFRGLDGRVRNLSEQWQSAGPGIVRNFAALLRVFPNQRVGGDVRYANATREPNRQEGSAL